jgi:hypothetical protein
MRRLAKGLLLGLAVILTAPSSLDAAASGVTLTDSEGWVWVWVCHRKAGKAKGAYPNGFSLGIHPFSVLAHLGHGDRLGRC